MCIISAQLLLVFKKLLYTAYIIMTDMKAPSPTPRSISACDRTAASYKLIYVKKTVQFIYSVRVTS